MASFLPPLTLQELQAAFPGSVAQLTPLALGGQGAVFRCNFTKDGTTLASALKIYFPGMLEERAIREVAALRVLNCPQIVRLLADGKTQLRGQDCLYTITEFVEGETLAEALKRGIMGAPGIARLGAEMCTAISALWSHRIVHRDIKPANILIRPDGGSVLIDLGLVRHIDLTSLTTTGKTWGTPGYMSPEQARTLKQLSCKSDVFSLAVVLQHCALGVHPTGGDQRQMRNGLSTLRGRVTLSPPALIGVIDSMGHREPHIRPLPQGLIQHLTSLGGP